MQKPDLSALSLIGEALRLTWKSAPHWWPLFLLYALAAGSLPETGAANRLALGGLVLLTVASFFHTLLSARQGQPGNFLHSLAQGMTCLPRMLMASWTLELAILAFCGVPIWVAFKANSVFAFYLAVAGMVLAVYAHARLLLAPGVCCCEKINGLRALQRANQLVHGHLGTLLFAYLASFLVGCLVMIPVAAVGAILVMVFGESGLWLAQSLQAGFFCLLPMSVQLIAYLRIRESAVDLLPA